VGAATATKANAEVVTPAEEPEVEPAVDETAVGSEQKDA